MHLIIISPPHPFPEEPQIARSILRVSPATFHLRKPGYDEKQLAAYLQQIPGDLHDRIMVHGHAGLLRQFPLKGIHFPEWQRMQALPDIRTLRHLHPALRISSSFHRIADIPVYTDLFDYILLSPIFDSISKPAYKAAFDRTVLTPFLADTSHQVVALGGIDRRRIADAAALGFAGVAVLGAVWSSGCPQQTARELSALCRRVTC